MQYNQPNRYKHASSVRKILTGNSAIQITTMGSPMPQLKRVFYTIRAWFVHFYTSLGIIVGLLAIISITGQTPDPKLFFAFLGLAILIDATDGTMARAWNVTTYASQLDGRKLDDITDFLNYTFIPIFFAYKFEIVSGWSTIVLAPVLILSVYGFCQNIAKTSDGFFTGFPNYWNYIIYYLFLFHWPKEINALVLILFAVGILVPVKYYNYSNRFAGTIVLIFSFVYTLVLVFITITLEQPDMTLVSLSLIFPVLYLGSGVFLYFRKTGHK